MFKKLERHWKVNSVQLLLVLLTFALGGSACGYLGRKLMLWINIERGWKWVSLYILFICLLWPVCVIIISVPFGQFNFFKKYLIRMWGRMSGRKKARIAIFASGTGSNAQKIIDHFKLSASVKIELIVCNKPNAGVLSIASNEDIPSLLISRERFMKGDAYLPELEKHKIDLIVLAGFLWKIPGTLINAFRGKIINIHPALLPKYGGSGMYGHYVHESVISNKEKESGITIHYVDEIYDHGEIIFQAKCIVEESDTPELLAQKIHKLEHEHFPVVIEKLLN